MICALDTTILVEALVENLPDHERCDAILNLPFLHAHTHALSETYAFLTGGRIEPRLKPSLVAQVIDESILPFVNIVSLTGLETMSAILECESRGVRGGAIYDFLHLTVARKVKAERLYTLNVRHFQAFWRPGDPEIVHP